MSAYRKLMAFMGITATAAATLGLSPGDPAPPFEARNQDGKTVRLSDFKGKPVLLYFYPKDDTPGCTREACQFRDEFEKFKKLGAVVLGVSRQDEESHQKFRAKHKIPFDLLVDHDGALAKLYGVELISILGLHKRQSVLISADGKIKKIYSNVDPAQHPEEVLRDIQS